VPVPLHWRSGRKVAALLGTLALVVWIVPALAAPGTETFALWAGVAGPGAALEWRPLGTHPDAESCEVARRDALEAGWKGLREVGVVELIALGHAGFTRVDPRTLETFTFRFACRAGPPPA
jgi:hypothetical protein